MTKKHFTLFANIIREDINNAKTRFPKELQRNLDAGAYAASTFARVAMLSNAKFDYERFMVACGLRDKP